MYSGHILLPGSKDDKVWYFYVQRQFVVDSVGLKPFVDVAKLAINKKLEFL